MENKDIDKEAKDYAFNAESVKCEGPDCGCACTSKFCNKDVYRAHVGGAQSRQPEIDGLKAVEADLGNYIARLEKQKESRYNEQRAATNELIEALEEATRWRDVDIERPNDRDVVLVRFRNDDETEGFGIASYCDRWGTTAFVMEERRYITHWRRIDTSKATQLLEQHKTTQQ